MTRIALGIEYNGSHFYGWQWQAKHRSVQQVLEMALSKIANHSVTVQCAGRTDAGVHALEQVVHFDSSAQRTLSMWLLGGNSQLPHDVRIIWANYVTDDFHARYSAIARFYRYVIFNRPVKSALQHELVTTCPFPLDAPQMHQAAQYLIGHHDFSSFRATGCQSKSPFRQMYFIHVYREGENVIIDLSANAFLHHMVRNIAGVLMTIGQGKQPVTWTQELLTLKNRSCASMTAPPDGLYLAGVFYPPHYSLPQHSIFNHLPADAKRFD